MKHQYIDRGRLLARANWLRKNQTWPEKRMWARLRRRQVRGYKFRRQHVLEPFIVDFYCLKCQIAVEVDGPAHAGTQKGHDKQRDEYLEEEHDVEVLRFTVQDVYQRLDEVLESIGEKCATCVDGEKGA